MRTILHAIPSLLALTTALALVGGCDAAADLEPGSAITFRPFTCSWCTTIGNSPLVNGASLAYIDLTGTNSAGIKISGVFVGKSDYYTLTLDADTDRFRGIDLNDPDRALEGEDFVGAKIVLEMNGGGLVYLEITDYDENVASWSRSGDPVTAYRAMYVSQGVPQPLCPSSNPENQWFTLIGGEIYDPVTHAITASSSALTIACVGEAAAKLKLLDYHPNGNYGSTAEQRQTTLRMITADYCGTGQSFTTQGVQVAWSNAAGTVEAPFAEDALEAKWGPNGAICLDYPREFTLDQVLDVCSIPSCEGDVDFGGAEWRTMLPG